MEKISRTKVVDLLKREDFGAMVNVKGWVRTRRGSKIGRASCRERVSSPV